MTQPGSGDQQQPGGDTGSGGDSGSGSGAAGAITIDYGGQVNSDAPKELKVGEPVEVTYANSVTKATVTVDDDDPNTEAWTKNFKFGEAAPEAIEATATQDQTDPRKVTLKVTQFPANAEKLTVDWGGAATVDQDTGSGSGGESGGQQGGSDSGQQSGGQQA